MLNKDILKHITVLYVEDEEDLLIFTSKTLGKLVKTISTAKNGREGLELFTKHHNDPSLTNFDVVITDINMPKMNGLEMIEAIHKISNTVPCVITTAHNDANFLKKAIDLGVSGYATKPLNLFQLLESISRSVESIILRRKLEQVNKDLEKEVELRTAELKLTIEKLENSSKELLHEATHDHLTNIFNRQKLNTELDKEISRSHRYKHNLSIIMLDIDFFKQINDTYGHNIGDEVLISISNISNSSIRNVDILARWGGEEFMILLPETTISNAINVAEHLRVNIGNAKLIPSKDVKITASFGVCTLKEKETKDDFLKRVDILLYEAKESGRDKVVSCSEAQIKT